MTAPAAHLANVKVGACSAQRRFLSADTSRTPNFAAMSNNSNNGGEMLHVATVTSLAGIVGVLIFVQLLRAQPLDTFSILVISVCFVVAVVVTAMWSKRSGE